jgi:hypothetical protein
MNEHAQQLRHWPEITHQGRMRKDVLMEEFTHRQQPQEDNRRSQHRREWTSEEGQQYNNSQSYHRHKWLPFSGRNSGDYSDGNSCSRSSKYDSGSSGSSGSSSVYSGISARDDLNHLGLHQNNGNYNHRISAASELTLHREAFVSGTAMQFSQAPPHTQSLVTVATQQPQGLYSNSGVYLPEHLLSRVPTVAATSSNPVIMGAHSSENRTCHDYLSVNWLRQHEHQHRDFQLEHFHHQQGRRLHMHSRQTEGRHNKKRNLPDYQQSYQTDQPDYYQEQHEYQGNHPNLQQRYRHRHQEPLEQQRLHHHHHQQQQHHHHHQQQQQQEEELEQQQHKRLQSQPSHHLQWQQLHYDQIKSEQQYHESDYQEVLAHHTRHDNSKPILHGYQHQGQYQQQQQQQRFQQQQQQYQEQLHQLQYLLHQREQQHRELLEREQLQRERCNSAAADALARAFGHFSQPLHSSEKKSLKSTRGDDNDGEDSSTVLVRFV